MLKLGVGLCLLFVLVFRVVFCKCLEGVLLIPPRILDDRTVLHRSLGQGKKKNVINVEALNSNPNINAEWVRNGLVGIHVAPLLIPLS